MIKPNLDGLEKTILESASRPPYEDHLTYLRNGMNKLGYDFPESIKGNKGAFKEACRSLWDIREKNRPLDDIPVTSLDDLPSDVVKIGNKEHYIHGIVHGVIKTSDSVKDFIKERAKNYAHRYNSQLFLEANFKQRFDLKNVGTEFKDHKSLKAVDILRILGTVPLVPFAFAAMRFNPKYRTMLNTLTDAQKDIRYLPRAKEAVDRIQMPEPLQMEYYSYSGFSRRMNNDRSEFMVDTMRGTDDYVKEVHAIVGLGHVDSIKYILSNPEFVP